MHPGVHGGDLNDVADDEEADTERERLAAAPPGGGAVEKWWLVLLVSRLSVCVGEGEERGELTMMRSKSREVYRYS